jgi:hypothetical protein
VAAKEALQGPRPEGFPRGFERCLASGHQRVLAGARLESFSICAEPSGHGFVKRPNPSSRVGFGFGPRFDPRVDGFAKTPKPDKPDPRVSGKPEPVSAPEAAPETVRRRARDGPSAVQNGGLRTSSGGGPKGRRLGPFTKNSETGPLKRVLEAGPSRGLARTRGSSASERPARRLHEGPSEATERGRTLAGDCHSL